jgi:hypothetical protein
MRHQGAVELGGALQPLAGVPARVAGARFELRFRDRDQRDNGDTGIDDATLDNCLAARTRRVDLHRGEQRLSGGLVGWHLCSKPARVVVLAHTDL